MTGSFTVGSTTVINTVSSSAEAIIFSNPVINKFIISNLPQNDNYVVSIYSLTGKIITSSALKTLNGSISIDINRFSEGIYILQVLESENFVITRKFTSL